MLFRAATALLRRARAVRVDGSVGIVERARRIAAFERRVDYDVMLLTSQVRLAARRRSASRHAHTAQRSAASA